MENVYPLLYLYCKQRGYDFSMVDLRCSVRNPFSEHHDTVQLHVESLQRCQGTLGPNFFVRYCLCYYVVIQKCRSSTNS
uniref:Uncharacterized protein n=1 Tax=Sphaeramia orbicularis TaxID=375764 RepID=A0A673AGE5_9TELE